MSGRLHTHINNIELFKNIGFDIELFGENSVKINGIPDIDYRVNSKNVFLDTLDEMTKQAFDDQCTGANPRYPLMSEIKKMYLNAYYGTNERV